MYLFDIIVLIDDDPINNLINKRLIKKLEISPQVEEFLEAEKALSFIKDLPPSTKMLALVDINMPVMNGWDFLLQYAPMVVNREDKIIMLSSSIDFQDRQKSKKFSYVNGFIEKPLTPEKLEKLLQ
ncbi:response regulator [Pleomorphovibrio marinus]|uniref:response regulator n=1 Tax=Pleomorphovibrio marinus TaxID=2164132 RepID=UPI000E0B9098|nr:response regulator [Pleomorphovibrio marinus]